MCVEGGVSLISQLKYNAAAAFAFASTDDDDDDDDDPIDDS